MWKKRGTLVPPVEAPRPSITASPWYETQNSRDTRHPSEHESSRKSLRPSFFAYSAGNHLDRLVEKESRRGDSPCSSSTFEETTQTDPGTRPPRYDRVRFRQNGRPSISYHRWWPSSWSTIARDKVLIVTSSNSSNASPSGCLRATDSRTVIPLHVLRFASRCLMTLTLNAFHVRSTRYSFHKTYWNPPPGLIRPTIHASGYRDRLILLRLFY